MKTAGTTFGVLLPKDTKDHDAGVGSYLCPGDSKWEKNRNFS